MVKAGDELSVLGNTRRLQTTTCSFKYVPSDTVGVATIVATRTGKLEATPAEVEGRIKKEKKSKLLT